MTRVPWDAEAERYVLGCVLWSRDLCAEAIRLLTPEDFFEPRHRSVFVAARELLLEGKGFTPALVCDRLRTLGLTKANANGHAVDSSFVAGLLHDAGAGLDFGAHVSVVQNRSWARRFISFTNGNAGELSNDELERRMREGVDVLSRMQRVAQEPPTLLRSKLQGDFEVLEERMRNRDSSPLPGLTSGFAQIDDLTNGFRPGQLIVVGAQTGMGKSALLISFALAAAKTGSRVLFFTLEMDDREVRERIYAQTTGIGLRSIIRGNLTGEDWAKLSSAAAWLSELKFIVGSVRNVTTADILADVRRIAGGLGGLDLIVVDYMQLLTPIDRRVQRYEQVGQMARDLKLMAGEVGVPIITASQLSRGLEVRVDKRPKKSDLRESGDIEHSADIILFVYRPWVYDAAEARTSAEIIIAKNRQGPENEIVSVEFIPERTLFRESHRPAPTVQQSVLGSEGAA